MNEGLNPRVQLGFALLVLGVFTGVEWTWGARPAVVLGTLLVVVETAWSTWRTGRLQAHSVGMLVLVVGFGGLAWWDESGVSALLLPAVGDLVLVAAGLVFHLMRGPPLVWMMEQQDPEPLHPLERRHFAGVGLRILASLLLHALVVVLAVQYAPTWALTVGGIGQMMWLGLHVMGEALWVRSRLWPALDALESHGRGEPSET